MSASSKMVKLNFVGIIGSECWSLEVGWFCAFQKVIKNGLIVCSCASCYVCCVVFEEILCYHVFDMTRNLTTRQFSKNFLRNQFQVFDFDYFYCYHHGSF